MRDSGLISRVERFAAFSDESSHSDGQFRSIATISLAAEHVLPTAGELREICSASDVREFKWQKLTGARDRFCAFKLLDHLFSATIPRGARVDVLVWNTQDTRHRIANRDDRANFERMFFHLHRKAMERRPPGSEWHLRPDERLDIDWKTVEECLRAIGRKQILDRVLFDELRRERSFQIKTLRQVVSIDQPLCQVADLFAGIAAYTRGNASAVTTWSRDATGQQPIDDGFFAKRALSRSDRERLPVVEHLYQRCRERRMGVSLRTNGYFKSLRGSAPVNFWHYEPQHRMDRAPIRELTRDRKPL